MRVASFCSGICAPEVAWRGLGWEPQFFSEIDPFALAVQRERFPNVPQLGDMEKITNETLERYQPAIVVTGTPCQSFSVAGLRKGLADPRGNLTLVLLRLLDRLRPSWLVWENVPGVLSSDGGRAFGAFLGGLGQLGYGFAYRVLDAQHFGVPQRRRRVFVVGHLGDWRRAAAVLFERHCLSGHPAPSREAGARIAASLTRGASSSGKGGYAGRRQEDDYNVIPSTGDTSHCLNAGGMGRQDYETETLISHTLMGKANASMDPTMETYVTHSLRGDGFDASEDGTGRGTPLVPDVYPCLRGGNQYNNSDPGMEAQMLIPILEAGKRCGLRNSPRDGLGIGAVGDPMFTLQSGAQHAIAFTDLRGRGTEVRVNGDVAEALHCAKGMSEQQAVAFSVDTYNQTLHQTLQRGTGTDQIGGVLEIKVDPIRLQGMIEGYGDAAETDAVKALRTLRSEAGEEAFAQWGLGVLASLWPQEVLRPSVYGGRLRREGISFHGLVHLSSSCSQASGEGAMRTLWEAGCTGCPPQGWGRNKQQAIQLAAYLSLLPQSPSPAPRFMRLMWLASQGAGLLREALSAIQEARRSADGQSESAPPPRQVRRLVPEECEALQGFPRGWTQVPYRGKPAKDAPRYKAIGNSMAVPVLTWIGNRIEAVEAIPSPASPAPRKAESL